MIFCMSKHIIHKYFGSYELLYINIHILIFLGGKIHVIVIFSIFYPGSYSCPSWLLEFMVKILCEIVGSQKYCLQ